MFELENVLVESVFEWNAVESGALFRPEILRVRRALLMNGEKEM